ncbi:hypothetical protein DP73_17790 [Desulfosporosinus sp. HMP52]|uniref:hypothetical protein n=1 Tax=Desulfosporosinus sp. HMP52 TaxID=1487923 RepID=UPI00051FA261|nr:hypothetical protein [Desulfosporosinus sp. HMP52]KGK85879.1 hypothetical protein DP73_17790 [Desulfosporosinus sp. HMP52]
MGIQSFLLRWKLGWKAQYIGGFTVCIKDAIQKHQKKADFPLPKTGSFPWVFSFTAIMDLRQKLNNEEQESS